MPQAKITLNAVPGSNTNLPINTLVQCSNQNIGGELTYLWAILDQPPGATDALSSLVIQNPTLTPKKEGTYLLKLTVNQGLPSEQQNRVVVGIQQLKTGERIPAAGETTEGDLIEGWTAPSNSILRRFDTMLGDPGILIGTNESGGSLARGAIVRVTVASVIKSTLPGQETIPGFTVAHSNVLAEIDELLCVVEGTIAGGVTVPTGGSVESRLMKVRYIGRYAAVTGAGTAAVGDTVYVNDSGVMSLTVGTIRRRVGSAMTAGATFDVWFNGVGGADIDLTPIDAKYITYGASSLTNAHRIDGANANGITGGLTHRFKAGDAVAGTVALEAMAFTGSTENIQNWKKGDGTTLAHVDSNGDLVFDLAARQIKWPTWYISESTTELMFNFSGAINARFGSVVGTSHLNFTNASGTTLIGQAGVDGIISVGAVTGKFQIATNGATRWQITAAGGLEAVGGNRAISNVLNPAAAQDAATMNYVDVVALSAARDQNIAHNGDFAISRRSPGGTFAFSGTRVRTLDRWNYIRTGSATVGTVARVSSGVLQPGPSVVKVQRTNADAGTGLSNLAQEIDRDFVRSILGQPLTITFWAKKGANFSATAGLLNITFITGTGAVTETGFGGYTGSQSDLNTGVAPTTSWVKYTVAVPALRSTISTAMLNFSVDYTGTASADDSIQIGEVMVNIGQRAAPFSLAGKTTTGEEMICYRYYENSYHDTEVPGVSHAGSAWTTSVVKAVVAGAAGVEYVLGYHPRFRVMKRVDVPTVALWSPTGTGDNWDNNGTDRAVQAGDVTGAGFHLQSGGALTPTVDNFRGHWACEAEW